MPASGPFTQARRAARAPSWLLKLADAPGQTRSVRTRLKRGREEPARGGSLLLGLPTITAIRIDSDFPFLSKGRGPLGAHSHTTRYLTGSQPLHRR